MRFAEPAEEGGEHACTAILQIFKEQQVVLVRK